MTAGPRAFLITIERATVTTDDYGDEIEVWASHAQAWARVRYGSGQERREAAQEAAVQTATFECDWSPTLETVTARDRVQFGGAWDITSAITTGLNRERHITAVRRD